MQYLLVFRKLYLLIKTNPLKALFFSGLLNCVLLRCIYLETNDIAKLVELCIMLINVIHPILTATVCSVNIEHKDEKGNDGF